MRGTERRHVGTRKTGERKGRNGREKRKGETEAGSYGKEGETTGTDERKGRKRRTGEREGDGRDGRGTDGREG